ncbi:uncharacterized protein LOC127257269 [Andrographis paniculata]|uniref:uncharacterized protein LOC127257269 n=1 Tax=Andrographis paniculata TaxID=175694 RepID=UPI0021E7F716|nr:uncharacterized protein LOC127257269 [Andrographis paniculata]
MLQLRNLLVSCKWVVEEDGEDQCEDEGDGDDDDNTEYESDSNDEGDTEYEDETTERKDVETEEKQLEEDERRSNRGGPGGGEVRLMRGRNMPRMRRSRLRRRRNRLKRISTRQWKNELILNGKAKKKMDTFLGQIDPINESDDEGVGSIQDFNQLMVIVPYIASLDVKPVDESGSQTFSGAADSSIVRVVMARTDRKREKKRLNL